MGPSQWYKQLSLFLTMLDSNSKPDIFVQTYTSVEDTYASTLQALQY